MAGLGRKVFAAGEILTAANVQGYLQDQVVMVFDDSADRTTVLGTAVSEGMVTYLKDSDATEVYTGADWKLVGQDLTQGTEGYTALSAGTAGISYQPVSPNYIINGAFEINQRSFTSTTATGTFTFDRWYTRAGGDGTGTFSAQAFSPADLSVEGFGESANHIRIVTSGSTSTDTLFAYRHNIEDVRTLAGQTVTISFWARAASGTPKIAIPITQIFGSGGSPAVITPSVSAITISTSWARYSQTITIPSVSGKTIGSGSYFLPSIAVSAGSDFDADHSSIGIQNNTFDIWGVQLEAGSVATPFKRNANSLQGELAACQRYYQRFTSPNAFNNAVQSSLGFSTSATVLRAPIPFRQTMRIPPTSIDFASIQVVDGAGGFAITSVAFANSGSADYADVLFTTGGGMTTFRPGFVNATASTGYVGFSAEL